VSPRTNTPATVPRRTTSSRLVDSWKGSNSQPEPQSPLRREDAAPASSRTDPFTARDTHAATLLARIGTKPSRARRGGQGERSKARRPRGREARESFQLKTKQRVVEQEPAQRLATAGCSSSGAARYLGGTGAEGPRPRTSASAAGWLWRW